jgi:adenylosuccinate synthase
MIRGVDIIFGLCWGDEGKGKISNALSKDYDYVCRWNGGPNAGHTVYLNDKKYKTHLIPSGVFHNKKSIIGPNCVINIDKFFDEIEYLQKEGFDTSLIKVSPKAHIITHRHIEYDLKFLKPKLGTTGQGIAPCYSDKMLRSGKLAKDYLESKYIWDGQLSGDILCEGAQSFWLDINHGDYPYVTSSETLPYAACSLGFSPKLIRDIIGVAKIYDTKSGVDPLFPESLWEDKELNTLIELGKEYGTTTGRKRLANWLNLHKLEHAIKQSGITKLVINKCDILEKLKIFKIRFDNPKEGPNFIKFDDFANMKEYISNTLKEYCTIIFSGDKEYI